MLFVDIRRVFAVVCCLVLRFFLVLRVLASVVCCCWHSLLDVVFCVVGVVV